MRVELPVCSANDSAVVKEKEEVRSFGVAHFRPLNVACEFAHANIAGARFALGSQRLLQQFPGVVTSISNQEKIAARFSNSLAPESNQALQPTSLSRRG